MRKELHVCGSLSQSRLLHTSHTISILLPLTRYLSIYLLHTMFFKYNLATSSGAHMEKHQSSLRLKEQLDMLDLFGDVVGLFICFCIQHHFLRCQGKF